MPRQREYCRTEDRYSTRARRYVTVRIMNPNTIIRFHCLGIEDRNTLRLEVGKREIYITFNVSFFNSAWSTGTLNNFKASFVGSQVAKSDVFRREGADVHSDAVISISQAIFGGTTQIRGIYDTIDLQVQFEIFAAKIFLSQFVFSYTRYQPVRLPIQEWD